ncbi:hypothetical protein DE146DRAFT_195072 [Phaeosphaeria sp. MPI-PUGE-AT-0046c]|nr:hypothetical protein DE146DRAFT_195072 [Phaeosphaeria sp. MPI-PUGE-AT-0046c]
MELFSLSGTSRSLMKARDRRRATYVVLELLCQRRWHEIMAHTLSREIKVKVISKAERREKHIYMLRPALDALLKDLRSSHEGHYMHKGLYEEAVDNVSKYKEAEPMRFEELAEANKETYA